MTTESFEMVDAVRERTFLLTGIAGPSGTGKTFSALRLATGMQRADGGDVCVIDTEADRSKMYADIFKFKHISLKAPFGAGRYLAAIEYAISKGARHIVVDSASHEHEGPGGVLAEFDRLFAEKSHREAWRMGCWAEAKKPRAQLISSIIRMRANLTFCFRAKEKIKPKKKGEEGEAVKEMGFTAITDDDWYYELPTRFLLLPGSNGFPVWKPDGFGARMFPRCPAPFQHLFRERSQLSEDIGEAMAKWARGGKHESAPIVHDDEPPMGALSTDPKQEQEGA